MLKIVCGFEASNGTSGSEGTGNMENDVIRYQQTGADVDFAPIFEGLRGLIGVLVRDKHGTADDLFQEGCIGLVDAARTFDPARGVPFKAYARKRIRWAISKAERVRQDEWRGGKGTEVPVPGLCARR